MPRDPWCGMGLILDEAWLLQGHPAHGLGWGCGRGGVGFRAQGAWSTLYVYRYYPLSKPKHRNSTPVNWGMGRSGMHCLPGLPNAQDLHYDPCHRSDRRVCPMTVI